MVEVIVAKACSNVESVGCGVGVLMMADVVLADELRVCLTTGVGIEVVTGVTC